MTKNNRLITPDRCRPTKALVTGSKHRVLTVFMLAMINISAVANIKNLPFMVEYGLSMIFYYALACFGFLVPCSLVAAELSTGWPEAGGVYVWVRKALGRRTGFVAIWLQWVNNLAWYPPQLSFIAGAIAYIINPELVHNKYYMAGMILGLFWLSVLCNLKGMRVSGWISTAGATVGTIIPGILIISLAAYWLIAGHESAMSFDIANLWPRLDTSEDIAFLAAMLLAFAGMEMSAVHVNEVKDPQRNYPRAILLSATLIIVIYVLGTMAVAVVVPAKEIQLVDGVMQAFARFFSTNNTSWLTPVMATLITCGSVAMLSTWLVGPAKGLLAASQSGDLPPFMQRVNKNRMPVGIILVQGTIASLLSLMFLLLPTVESAFWLLIVLCTQVYTLMYLLMFISAIILKFRHPEVKRTFHVPGGRIGMVLISGIGITSCIFAIVVGLMPPTVMDKMSILNFELILVGGIVLFISPPILLDIFRKPSWKQTPPLDVIEDDSL